MTLNYPNEFAKRPKEFRLPCFFAMKRSLGETDACAECVEIARRSFEAAVSSNADPIAMLQSLSREYAIKVDSVDWKKFRQQTIGLHLVAIRQALETFEDAFMDEHVRMRPLKEHKESGMTTLDFILEKMSLNSLKSTFEYRVVNYYRLQRNLVAHSIQGPKTKHVKMCANLRFEVSTTHYEKLKAPNTFSDLCFDDYVLFSRCAKGLAAQLCGASEFSVEEFRKWSSGKIKAGKNDRKMNALRTALRSNFGLSEERSTHLASSILTAGPVA